MHKMRASLVGRLLPVGPSFYEKGGGFPGVLGPFGPTGECGWDVSATKTPAEGFTVGCLLQRRPAIWEE